MIRCILVFLLAFLLPLSMSASDVDAQGIEQGQGMDKPQITIYFDGTSLRITGASGLNLYVYSITGIRVMSIKVEGADKNYNLNLKRGCYIVKVGNVVRKIAIS